MWVMFLWGDPSVASCILKEVYKLKMIEESRIPNLLSDHDHYEWSGLLVRIKLELENSWMA